MGLDHRRDYGKGAEKAGQTVESLAVKDPGPGWIPWEGGEQPKETYGKRVQYKMRDQSALDGDRTLSEDPAAILRWWHVGQAEQAGMVAVPEADIVAYRIID